MRRPDKDEVLAWPEVMEHADDLDVEALGLRAVEDGEPVALHPLVNLGDADGARARGVCAEGRWDGRAQGEGRAEGDSA